uniref:BEL1-like homeodomain protein 8 n=1 Tax=Erigeron canadensis TaxID=72917 RepID=UPI001CB8EA6A|nr:BEL1-like homeodomain protein 8 [Erigeron canadensis]
MDMNNSLRTESHVAQKNRRHKLRFQHSSDDPTHQHDPSRYGSISYDPSVFPPEMLNSIASNPHLLLPQNHALFTISHDQDSGPGASPASFPSCKVIGDNSNWKSVVTSSSSRNQVQVSNDEHNSNWNNNNNNNNNVGVVGCSQIMVVDHHHNQDLHNSNNNNNNDGHLGDHQKNYGEVPTFSTSPYYQNISLQEVVTVGNVHPSKNFLEMSNNNHESAVPCWMNNNATSDHHQQLGFIAHRNNNNNNEGSSNRMITQGLSLSLSSSVPRAKNEYPNNLHSKGLKGGGDHVLGMNNSDAKQLMGMYRNIGPLGPFTGYATILKNSKYLKPAQELLNDNCDVGGQDPLVQTACHDQDNDHDTHKILHEEMSRVTSGESTGASSSSTIYGSNEYFTGRSSSLSESYRPEFHQKKAKLLYMQEEVCRRYKQYHQQMQLVISSFETVAGLTTATPYVSLALKSVSRHFHFVKNAISEQLTQMKKTFEDLCSPSKAFDGNTTDSLSQLKSMDRHFQRHGSSSGGTGLFGNQQPVWRPQRGLPERAVSVLKAWLFDHFLHPYPSDADKHMLATQTGLTRNQVSNWFINARVRIWKPMVEEIHSLETKGLADSNTNNSTPADCQETTRMDTSSVANKQAAESSRNSGPLTILNGQNAPNEQLWDHDKQRSRQDYQIPPATLDRTFTSIIPYSRTTFEAGGVGPVSLTLGLRQNAEHVQQLQQHEHQLRQRFGGQLIHDFVG